MLLKKLLHIITLRLYSKGGSKKKQYGNNMAVLDLREPFTLSLYNIFVFEGERERKILLLHLIKNNRKKGLLLSLASFFLVYKMLGFRQPSIQILVVYYQQYQYYIPTQLEEEQTFEFAQGSREFNAFLTVLRRSFDEIFIHNKHYHYISTTKVQECSLLGENITGLFFISVKSTVDIIFIYFPGQLGLEFFLEKLKEKYIFTMAITLRFRFTSSVSKMTGV